MTLERVMDELDVPLICDPVPGPSFDVERIVTAALALQFSGVLTVILGRKPTPDECVRQAEWEASGLDGLCPALSVLGGLQPERPREWPDAEFCAA